MSFNLEKYFEKNSESDWLQVALKSLKLDNQSELDKYLSSPSIENFTYHLNPPRDINPIHINTFPEDIQFTREINNGQSNLESADLGVSIVLSAHPTIVHKGQTLFQVLTTPTMTHFGDLVLIDLISIIQEFSKKPHKLGDFIDSKMAQKNTHFLVDGARLHNAGLGMCSEISFSLHLALKYLEVAQQNKKKIYFTTATDSMFFANISKLRALRYLFETVLESSGIESSNAFEIIAKPSLRETTLFNPWANALRSTVSVAGHMIAGADYSVGASYNQLEQRVTLKEIDELGLRQSRNIFHVLKEESGLNFVKDPSRGSYTIEDLTRQLISNSFEELKSIEEIDFDSLVESYSKKAKEESVKRQEAINCREKTVCGINDFAEASDSIHKKIKYESFNDKDGDPFPLRRDVKDIEKLRFKAINDPALSKKYILIVTMGDMKSLGARVNFCENYFNVLGLETGVCDVANIASVEFDKYCGIVYCAKDEDLEEMVKLFPPSVNLKNFVAGKKYKHQNLLNIFQGQNIVNVLATLVEGEL